MLLTLFCGCLIHVSLFHHKGRDHVCCRSLLLVESVGRQDFNHCLRNRGEMNERKIRAKQTLVGRWQSRALLLSFCQGREHPAHGLLAPLKSLGLALPRQLQVGLEIQQTNSRLIVTLYGPVNDAINTQMALGREKDLQAALERYRLIITIPQLFLQHTGACLLVVFSFLFFFLSIFGWGEEDPTTKQTSHTTW